MKSKPVSPVKNLLDRLAISIPDPRMELSFVDPFTLLVATVLSAQSTDKTVNQITPGLFARFPDAASLEKAPVNEVEELIRPTGFFHRKALHLISLSTILMKEFHGKVPQRMADLTRLPGVGRKTASVVLAFAYHIPAIPVDTHVMRVSKRLGLTVSTEPDQIEADLCGMIPREQWITAGSRLLLHGRYVCLARKPSCSRCVLADLCPSSSGFLKN